MIAGDRRRCRRSGLSFKPTRPVRTSAQLADVGPLLLMNDGVVAAMEPVLHPRPSEGRSVAGRSRRCAEPSASDPRMLPSALSLFGVGVMVLG